MSRKKYKKNKDTAMKQAPENTETPVVETAVVPEPETEAKTEPAQPEVKTEWKPIIKDFVILMVIMSILGYACNLIKDAFAHKSPTDSLVSLIRKGDVQDVNGEEKDEPFIMELADGTKKNPDFVNTRDANERTPLMWAAYANFNDPEQANETDINRIYYVEALFDNHANIHATDEDGFNALHWASWSGMRFTSYKLVKKGIDINLAENNGYTPLMLAAMRGNDSVVDLLLKMGADPSAVNKDGKTAAQLATDAELAYSKRDSWVYGPVFSQNREDAYRKTCQLLSGVKAKISAEELAVLEVELQIEMLASQAASRAQTKIADLAKKEESRASISLIPLVSLNEADIDLHHRVKGEVDAIKAMDASVEGGLSQTAFAKVDDAGNSALHIAARDGKALCCQHLLAAGFDVALKNKAGKTPLSLAVENGHTLAVETLLSVDKPEMKALAAEVVEQVKDVPAAQPLLPLLQSCNPISQKLSEFEFESRRVAIDKAYAEAKQVAAAKAKAEAEAAAKAEAEALAKAAAEKKAREEALALAEKTAAETTARAAAAEADAVMVKKEAQIAKVAAERAKAKADAVMAEAEWAKAEADTVKAEAERAKDEAEAAKAEAEAAKAEAEAAKAEAEAAKAEAEAAKAAADKAKAAYEATQAPAPVQQ